MRPNLFYLLDIKRVLPGVDGKQYVTIVAGALTTGDKTVSGKLTVDSEIWLKNNVWHCSIDGAYRLYFGVSSGVTFLAGENTDPSGICALFMSDTISVYKKI